MLVLLLGDAGGSTVDTGNIAPSTGASGNNPGLPFAARNEAGTGADGEAGDAAHENPISADNDAFYATSNKAPSIYVSSTYAYGPSTARFNL